MQNSQGGSLRNANPGSSAEEKKEVRTIIENDPRLKELVQGGPELSADALSELQQPPWAGQPPQAGPSAAPPPPVSASGPQGFLVPPPAQDVPPPFPWLGGQPQPGPQPPQGANRPAYPPPMPLEQIAPSAAQEPPSRREGPPPEEAQRIWSMNSEPQKAPEGDEGDEKKLFSRKTMFELMSEYKCSFFWENDPATFGAEAFLYGEVSDVVQLNQALRVRFRSITASEAAAIDDYVPRPSGLTVSHRPEILEHHRALVRLAMSITHINGSPLGDMTQRLATVRRLPEAMTKVLSDAAAEFYVRMNARLIGAQEQLKN